MLIGSIIGMLLTPLADKYGRRIILIITLLSSILVYIGFFIIKSVVAY
jgi:MFS family permease